jgi:hypothetical protein
MIYSQTLHQIPNFSSYTKKKKKIDFFLENFNISENNIIIVELAQVLG